MMIHLLLLKLLDQKIGISLMSRLVLDFLELIKLKILFASILTSCLGYLLSLNQNTFIFFDLFWGCFGLFFIFSAAAALNHYLEIDIDSKMQRTINRPLPSGRFSRKPVLSMIIVFIIIGSFILFLRSNIFVLFSALITLLLYDFVYTPLKKVTSFNTFIGAIPGALPFVCGWFIGNSNINLIAIVSFLIFYFWQLPHFYSISWINKESYEKADLKMISVYDEDGKKTKLYMFYSTLVFIFISYLPLYFNFFYLVYSIGISILNLILFFNVFKFLDDVSYKSARSILICSITYPPCILLFVLIERYVL